MSKRRVVVTGLGAVTPIGNNVKDFWAGIRAGKVGIGPITKFDTTDYKVKENIAASIPMGSMGTTEDVAKAAAFLASDGARYITGQVLRVDGGMAM